MQVRVFANHETRNTAIMLFTNHETRITDLIAIRFAVGAPGRRKMSQHENRRPVMASLSNISQHFPAKKLPLRQSPRTIRIGNTACWVCTRHDAQTGPLGTEALQSFFLAPAGLA